jgi:hypothetical protein
MSRVHVVGYVTELIWAALSGVLRDAGVVIDPARPLPPIRPQLTLHQALPRRSADDTVPTAMMQDK